MNGGLPVSVDAVGYSLVKQTEPNPDQLIPMLAGEAEQRIAIGVEFGRKPCRGTNWREIFDDRRGVMAARAMIGAGGGACLGVGIGAECRAQLGGEQVHDQ